MGDEKKKKKKLSKRFSPINSLLSARHVIFSGKTPHTRLLKLFTYVHYNSVGSVCYKVSGVFQENTRNTSGRGKELDWGRWIRLQKQNGKGLSVYLL